MNRESVFGELVDLLAESADPRRVQSFRLSRARQARLDKLLEKNRRGRLTEEEAAELDEFEHVEHVVRLLKARLAQKASE